MALIKCGECNAEMSDKADKCPKCGAPAKKKTSLFTWIVAGFFGLIIISAIGNKTSTSETASVGSNENSTSDNTVTYTPPKPEWAYHSLTDAVSGKESKQASITSNNSFELDFPYQGGTTANIIIRNHPRYGKDVIFTISKGQLLCNSYDGCEVSVRFDDKKPFKVHALEPEDNSSETLFLSGYNKLLKEIRNSKTMIIEATFFQNGARAFEFDVSNLKFE